MAPWGQQGYECWDSPRLAARAGPTPLQEAIQMYLNTHFHAEKKINHIERYFLNFLVKVTTQNVKTVCVQ